MQTEKLGPTYPLTINLRISPHFKRKLYTPLLLQINEQPIYIWLYFNLTETVDYIQDMDSSMFSFVEPENPEKTMEKEES